MIFIWYLINDKLFGIATSVLSQVLMSISKWTTSNQWTPLTYKKGCSEKEIPWWLSLMYFFVCTVPCSKYHGRWYTRISTSADMVLIELSLNTGPSLAELTHCGLKNWSIALQYTISNNLYWYNLRSFSETFSALLALCEANPAVIGSSQRPMTRIFGGCFDLRLNKWLNKQSRRRWFETTSCSLWRHFNDKTVGGVI